MVKIEGLAAIVAAETWSRLATSGVGRSVNPGRVLIRQGDDADHVQLILKGRVKVARVDAEGNTLVLAVRGPGELIGELGLLNPSHKRSATVTAIDRCSTRIIPVDDFRTMMRDLGLEARLLEHVVARLQEGEDVRAELSALPAGLRVPRCLLRLAIPRSGTGVGMPERIDVGLNQTELAQATGVHRSTVAAELRKLRRDGIVSTSGRRLVITDVTRLRARVNDHRISS